MASKASPPAASELDSYGASRGAVSDQVVGAGSGKGMQVRGIKISGDKAATWLLESLAAHHMTGDLSLLTDMIPVSNQLVGEGNGKGMQVCAIGSVITEAVVLPNVWYVPGLGMNQVSVDQVTTDDPDLIIMMAGTVCHVTKISDGSVIGSAHLRPDYKYEVDFLRIQQN